MSNQLVTVERFYSLMAFDQAKAALESNGIKVFADSESTVSVHPWYAAAIGGLRVKVLDTDAEAARQILRHVRTPIDEEQYAEKVRRAKLLGKVSVGTGILIGAASGVWMGSIANGLQITGLITIVVYLAFAHVFVTGPRL